MVAGFFDVYVALFASIACAEFKIELLPWNKGLRANYYEDKSKV